MSIMSSSRKIELIKNSIERIIILLLCASILAITVFVLLFIYEPNQNALGALGSVCMDIVCILVLIILIVSITYEREVIDRTTRLFLMLMLGTMVAMLFDYLTWSLDGTLDFGKLNFVFIVSSLCMGSILAGIFVLYLCSYLYDMYHLERLQKIAQICLVFNIASFALALLLAVTGNAFELVDGHYVPGPFYDYVTVVPVLTLLFMTAYAIKNIKIIGLHDVIAVSGFIFTMIAGALIEAECDIGTTYVSITIADLYIFVMLCIVIIGFRSAI